jgi:hypothetical protein
MHDRILIETSEICIWSSSPPKVVFFNILESLRKVLQLTFCHQEMIQWLTKSNNTRIQISIEHMQNLTGNF